MSGIQFLRANGRVTARTYEVDGRVMWSKEWHERIKAAGLNPATVRLRYDKGVRTSAELFAPIAARRVAAAEGKRSASRAADDEVAAAIAAIDARKAVLAQQGLA